MIIFNGTEAFEISSLLEIENFFVDHSIESKRLPFVELRRSENNTIECDYGYISADGIRKDADTIRIGHVNVCLINVNEEKHEENMWISDDYYIDYHYSIIFYIDENGRERYTFSSTDRVIYENGKIKTKSNFAIISFFTYIIPLINSDIDAGIPLCQLNVDYYRQKYKDGDKVYDFYETDPFEINLYDTLDLIYSVKVEIVNRSPHVYSPDDVTCYASFEGKKGVIYNIYVANLIGAIINASMSKYNEEIDKVKYKGKLYELPNYLKYDEESLRRYILRKLYVGILLNYDQKMATEGFHHADFIRDFKDIEQDESVRSLLNFILGIKATHYEDGESRVGRDDMGWEEITVLFPKEYGYKPSSTLLELINNTLGVKLEDQEDNLCYYSRYTTKAEYIAGSARRRDIGSFELQRYYMHKLMELVILQISIEGKSSNLY